MDWHDRGTILSCRAQGETAMLIEVFTAAHGRARGVVAGGLSRKKAAFLQPGSKVSLVWRARLDDQLGRFSVEPLASRAGAMSDRLALLGLNAVCTLLSRSLAEREPHPGLFAATEPLFEVIGRAAEGWPLDYLHWEARLLEDLGYGLDLSCCAVTGGYDDLCYISPRSGRAVSREGAGDWAERLLPLPPCLLGQGPASWAEICAGLRATGHFLERFAADHHRRLPESRARLIGALNRNL